MKFNDMEEARQNLKLGSKIDTELIKDRSPSQEINLYEQGFVCVQPRFLRKNEIIAYRYDDIESFRIFCASYSSSILGSTVSSGCTLIYRYFIKNGKGKKSVGYNKQEDFASVSRKLMETISKSLKSRLWLTINSIINSSGEASFGYVTLSKEHIKTTTSSHSSVYPLSEIEEVKLYLSSDDDSLEVFLKPDTSKRRRRGSIIVNFIENPHLFIKALKMLEVNVNFTVLPEFGNIEYLDKP